MKKSLKKQVLVEIKIHIWYITCGNWKHYDIFSEWNRFWFYSQSRDKELAWLFRVFDKLEGVFSKISNNNDKYIAKLII